jgi:hypothetical protein
MKITLKDYILANKRASRQIELDENRRALTVTKIHQSKKKYSRKNKHKNKWVSD